MLDWDQHMRSFEPDDLISFQLEAQSEEVMGITNSSTSSST
jgi:hypothetical protein